MDNQKFKSEICETCKDKRCGRTDSEILNCQEFGLYRSPYCDGCKTAKCPHQTEKDNILPELIINSCSEWS